MNNIVILYHARYDKNVYVSNKTDRYFAPILCILDKNNNGLYIARECIKCGTMFYISSKLGDSIFYIHKTCLKCNEYLISHSYSFDIEEILYTVDKLGL